jgi:hypothetical protein
MGMYRMLIDALNPVTKKKQNVLWMKKNMVFQQGNFLLKT